MALKNQYFDDLSARESETYGSIFASPAPPQQASPNWNDTPSEEAPLTGLLSNLHSTLRLYHNLGLFSS